MAKFLVCPFDNIPSDEWDKLPKKEQAFLVLKYAHRMPYEEIMDHLFIDNTKTVYRLNARTKSFLNRRMTYTQIISLFGKYKHDMDDLENHWSVVRKHRIRKEYGIDKTT